MAIGFMSFGGMLTGGDEETAGADEMNVGSQLEQDKKETEDAVSANSDYKFSTLTKQ